MTLRWLAAATCAAAACAPLPARAGVPPPAPPLPTAGAPVDLSRFAYRRRIPPGPRGPVTLRLDEAARLHSTVDDVRVVTPDGVQVPYLVEPDAHPVHVALGFSRVDREDGAEMAGVQPREAGGRDTLYAIGLPGPDLREARLVLRTDARVFAREVRVLAPAADPRRWWTVASGTWRHTDPDTPAPPLEVDLPTLSATTLRLAVDDGDNRPLPIERPSLELPTWRLTFVRETGVALFLAYGHPGLDAPRYDLALIAPRLRTEPAVEVTADPETPAPAPWLPAAASRTAFYAVLGLAVLALLALVARHLGSEPPSGSSSS